MYLIRETCLRYKTNILFLAFYHAKESISSNNTGRLTRSLAKAFSETGPLSHCVKSVQIHSFLWSVFSCIRAEYGDLRSKSPYSVRIQSLYSVRIQSLYSIRIQENTDQKKLRIWTLSRSVRLHNHAFQSE